MNLKKMTREEMVSDCLDALLGQVAFGSISDTESPLPTKRSLWANCPENHVFNNNETNVLHVTYPPGYERQACELMISLINFGVSRSMACHERFSASKQRLYQSHRMSEAIRNPA